MQIVVGGASGFLGSHLTAALASRGHDVVRLVRREPGARDESRWDPARGELDASLIERADVVVNVAGSSTFGNPHSRRWAADLLESRVSTTRTLAQAVAVSQRKPAFLAGNAIAVYGDHGDLPVTEESDSRGHAFMTDVTRRWEAAAEPARASGSRVCILRTAPVIDRRSEPLRTLRRLFRCGLGGRIGDGRQYFPIISLRDWVGGVVHLVEHDDERGRFNLCCPVTPTNREFTTALARAVARPAVVPVPAALVRVGAGRLGPELLNSVNLVPQALLDAGYEFRDRDAVEVIAAGLGQSR